MNLAYFKQYRIEWCKILDYVVVQPYNQPGFHKQPTPNQPRAEGLLASYQLDPQRPCPLVLRRGAIVNRWVRFTQYSFHLSLSSQNVLICGKSAPFYSSPMGIIKRSIVICKVLEDYRILE